MFFQKNKQLNSASLQDWSVEKVWINSGWTQYDQNLNFSYERRK